MSWFWWHRSTFSPFQKGLYGNHQNDCTLPKRQRPRFQEGTVIYLAWYEMSNTRRKKNKVPNIASDNQPSQNLTLHLNKKHVLFQVERSEEVLKTAFLVRTEATSPPELKKTFLERTQRRFGKFLFCSRNKIFLKSIRCHKTSQTQEGKSQSTNRSLRSLARPKRDSAFEQKTRIVPSRGISASSQNSFFLQPKNQAEQCSKRHFWNVLNVVLENFYFAEATKAVF